MQIEENVEEKSKEMLASYDSKELVWEHSNGDEILIQDMTDHHIHNCHKYSISKNMMDWTGIFVLEILKRGIEDMIIFEKLRIKVEGTWKPTNSKIVVRKIGDVFGLPKELKHWEILEYLDKTLHVTELEVYRVNERVAITKMV